MITDSRILAWRIPWTEEPVGLQSMGSQRVRHARMRFTQSFHATCCSLSRPLLLFLECLSRHGKHRDQVQDSQRF